MPEQPAKKLNLPLYLNASLSRADGAAMVALQQWYEKAQNSCSDRAELEGMIRAFHHDLYLAGLRLYLLDPRLCRQIADTLEQKNLTLDALAQQLGACGLWPETRENGFSPDQLTQLKDLLATATPASPPAADEAAEDAKASPVSKQLSEQKKQLTAMQAELQKLRVLAEEQARQLRDLKVAAPAPALKEATRAGAGAEEMDVSNMTANIAKMKKVRGKGVF